MNVKRLLFYFVGGMLLLWLSIAWPLRDLALPSLWSSDQRVPTIAGVEMTQKQTVQIDPAERAIAYLVERDGLEAERITVVRHYPMNFPAIQRQFQFVTLTVEYTNPLQIERLLVDLKDGHIEEDIAAVREAESLARQDEYGRLERALFERLQTISDSDELPVAVWMATAEGQSLGELQLAVFNELAAEYPEAQEAMLNSGKAIAVDDPELAQHLSREYSQRLRERQTARTQPLVAELEQRGFEVTVYEGMPSLAVVLPKSVILELNERPDVSAIYLTEGEEVPALDSAVPNTFAPAVWSDGYDGTGVTIAILEHGNVDTNNTFLNHAPMTLVAANGVQGHTTRVASSAASFHQTHTGMAPGATILSAGSYDGFQTGAVYGLQWAIVWQDAPIVNYSAGFYSADRELHWIDRAFDYWAREEFALVVVAAGNLGGNIISPGRGWNVLTVGAYNDQNNVDWSDDNMHAESAYINPCGNPSDCEGREKPEVVAVGGDVQALGISNIPFNDFGTSFAAPQAAGLGALLIDRQPILALWPEATRAIIMASATHNIEGRSIIRFYDPTDMRDGAGAINALLAVETAQTQATLSDSCQVSCWWGYAMSPSFTQHEHTFYAEAGDLIRVALSWWSNPDPPEDDYSFDRLETNLDLEIINPLEAYADISISSDNNYEMVEFMARCTGLYRARVRRWPTAEAYNFVGVALVKTDLPYGLYLPLTLSG